MINIEILNYSKCSCGAITFSTNCGEYSCEIKNVKQFFPGLDLRTLRKGRLEESYCCDHCVNHYGLDLCGCGSGEPFGKCENGLPECSQPMQKLGEYTSVLGSDSWLGGVA